MGGDLDGPVGPVDFAMLQQIRELIEREEPLIESTTFDDPINPTELVVTFTEGVECPGRFEITWWQRGGYRFHYTEPDGVDFRFDRHPKADAPDAHFHPPPDAGPATDSVLAGADQPQVVTRAVLSQWRAAVIEGEGVDAVNADA